MSVIAYDRPVQNLIAELDATGHITHTSHQKTMVTLHHNGGGPNFTAQQIVDIWKSREASAHFDVDAAGDVAQFANVGDYAWACANTLGNEISISIEMANSTLGPRWEVSDTTWQSAARLAGWLFAHVIGARPTAETLVYHSHWYATACAGPYMDSVYPQVLAAAQAAYDAFTERPAPTPPTPSPVAPKVVATNWVAGPKVARAMQDHWRSLGAHDGEFSLQDDRQRAHFPAANWTCIQWVAPASALGSEGVRAIQRAFGLPADGLFGPVTARAVQGWAGVKQDGICGTLTVEAVAKKLGVA